MDGAYKKGNDSDAQKLETLSGNSCACDLHEMAGLQSDGHDLGKI